LGLRNGWYLTPARGRAVEVVVDVIGAVVDDIVDDIVVGVVGVEVVSPFQRFNKLD
jgi:hypothetical protein